MDIQLRIKFNVAQLENVNVNNEISTLKMQVYSKDIKAV